MSKNLLLLQFYYPYFGGIVGTSMHKGPKTKTEPLAAITIDPHAPYMAIDIRALPEQQVKEPF